MWFRLIFLFALGLLANTALGQSIDQQLVEAVRNFRPIANSDKEWKTHSKLIEGLEGRWWFGVQVFLENGETSVPPEKMRSGCERLGTEVSVAQHKIMMKFSRKQKDGSFDPLETVYVDRGNNEYGFMRDPDQLLKRLGLNGDIEEKMLPVKYEVLRSAIGIAKLFRPSKDVLAIFRHTGQVEFGVRCPID